MTDRHNLAGCSVMVVEDEFYIALDLKKTLEGFGAEVIGPFADVDDAVRGLEEKAPSCAILDVNLSGRSAYELGRLLRARSVPIAFYTGYDQAMMPAEFADDARLEKPVDADLLGTVVRKLCGQSGPIHAVAGHNLG